jgi:hypothetical protein
MGLGLRVEGSDRVAASALKGLDEFRGKRRVTAAQLC